MAIYSIIITILAAAFAVGFFKWKIAAHAITMYCIEHDAEPTADEMSDYSKRAAAEMVKDLFRRE